jgi:hypothetical protein
MSPPNDTAAPPLRSGALVTPDELTALAKQAVERSGRTLTSIAGELEKSVGYVHDALNRPDRNLTAFRLEILRLVAGYTADGPLFRLRRAEG